MTPCADATGDTIPDFRQMPRLQQPPFYEFLDVSVLDRMFHYFRILTGLHVGLMDVEGNCVYASDKRVAQRCRLCKLVQSTPEGSERCREEFARAGHEAFRWGEPYFFECWLGLMEWAVPLVVEGELVGSIICGQTIVGGEDEAFEKNLLEQAREIGVPERRAVEGAREILVIQPETMKAAAEMLRLIAQQICGVGEQQLEARRRQQEHQRRIAESLHARKMQGMPTVYPLDMEKQLIAHVRLGEVEKAKALVNHLLGAIFFRNQGRPQILKARVLELLAQLSRAAVEGGAELEETLGANLKHLRRIHEADNQEEVCECLRDALDQFTDGVYASRNTEQMRILSDAMAYVRERYADSVSLQEAARAVHRNPSTLRKLFREQLGVTFTEYVNKTRVEAAEELLRNPDLSLAQIAVMVGFYDQSHFGKVFRNLTGYTPASYRRKIL